MEDVAGQILGRAARVGLAPAPAVIEALVGYVGLLTKWNQRLNLTALELEPMANAAIDRLLIEPLLAATRIRPEDRLAVDVGSGGGSPAIPLRIAIPVLRYVLVEVKIRKCAFLREAIRQLGLEDTEVASSRIEMVSERDDLRGSADLVTLRAVRPNPALWSAVVALLKPGGRVFWFGAALAGIVDPSPNGSLGVVEVGPLFPGFDLNQLAILEKLS